VGFGTVLEDRSQVVFLAKEEKLSESDRPGDPREDESLLDGIRAGDVSAFERLYELHGARMKSVAANLLGNPADAEDAVQETFLKVYRGAAAFRGTARISTWIYRVLVNACYDMMRRKRRRPVEVAGEPAPGTAEPEFLAPASDHPLRLSLEASVKDLEPRRRSAFVLYAVEGFTHREIGEILGIPEGTSKALLFEARRDLQRRLSAAPRREATP
jgi:RNA polymerase sigma-70 factor (ECF subfamily)